MNMINKAIEVIEDPANVRDASLQEQFESERDSHLRLAAEYQNYRRRTEKEKEEWANNGKRDLLIQLLTLADDMELSIGAIDMTSEPFAEGLRLLQSRLLKILKENGVHSFDSEGERFDPERHEAFDIVVDKEPIEETVHKEMRRGYFWNGALFRPALVVVSK
jgi:molecular chaperone GrpE